MSVRYRADIDGLRAVAIVPVVLYHFNVPGFGGGYVGVDVFFVISGFLITSLIHSELEAGQFSILRFYERRIRRILPALLAVLVATSVLGLVELFPLTLADFGKSLAATGGFLSNVEFWRESGYFDSAADQKPLLHTWSLAVEEQFYLLFPPTMMTVARVLAARYVPAILLAFFISFGLSVWGAYALPAFAFYLLPARMWELLLGSLLAVGTANLGFNPPRDETLAVAGLAMIGVAVFLYSEETVFPGAAALLPCLGAAGLTFAGIKGAPALNMGLSWSPIVFLGQISYSLYLWHWPIFVYWKAHVGRDPAGSETVLLIALAGLIAALSWRYIEQPFRKPGGVLARPALFAASGSAIALSIAGGIAIWLADGVPQRFDAGALARLRSGTEIVQSGRCLNRREYIEGAPLCRIGGGAEEPTFLLWGDSHARALIPALAKAAQPTGRSGVVAVRNGCLPLIGVDRAGSSECRRHNDEIVAYVKANRIDTIILVARWTASVEGAAPGGNVGERALLVDDQHRELSAAENAKAVFERGFTRTLETLASDGRRVIVFGPIPEIGSPVPETLARRYMRNESEDIGPTLAAFEARNGFVLSRFQAHADEADYLYPHSLLCKEKRCAVARGAQALYSDDNHLSRLGAESLAVLFEPLLQRK